MITKRVDTVTLEELWADTTDGYIPVLMEIYNPDLKWGDNDLEQENMYLRVISDDSRVKYKGKTYVPCTFSFKPPAEDGTKVGTASISISNLDSRIQQMIGSIKLVSDVKVVAAFAKTGSKYYFKELSHWTFQMESANANRTTATFNLIPHQVFNLNVPRGVMDMNQLNSMVNE